jgi:hypothetical protein
MDDAEAETAGHAGVHGVAAGLEDPEGGEGGQGVTGRDRVAGAERLRAEGAVSGGRSDSLLGGIEGHDPYPSTNTAGRSMIG